jgi:hypothetical protein
MESQTVRRVRLLKHPGSERRASTRFPLNLEVRYTVAGCRAPVEGGSGRTIDMSSSGLSFTADRPLPTGVKLEVSIDWPALLDGGVQLQLVVSGVVVRSSGAVIALRIERHEFRTRRVGLQVVPCGPRPPAYWPLRRQGRSIG